VRLELVLCATVALGACSTPWSDLVTSHVEPGGAITASLDSGAMQSTKAMGDGHANPMTVDGNSTTLVFGLVVGEDANGKDATPELLMNNATVDLAITSTSRSKLSVYADHHGCVANQATVHLRTDGNGAISGDFQGTGIVAGGSASCAFQGMLAGVPVDK
jgi:hypothetical protein